MEFWNIEKREGSNQIKIIQIMICHTLLHYLTIPIFHHSLMVLILESCARL